EPHGATRPGGLALECPLTEGATPGGTAPAWGAHAEGKGRAGPTTPAQAGADPRREIGVRRHAFAIAADRLQLAEGQHRTRIDVDHLVHIAGVIVPGSLEGGNLPLQKPP